MDKIGGNNISIQDNVKRIIADERAYLKNLHYRFAKRLPKLYEYCNKYARLSYYERNKERYYSLRWMEDGTEVNRYIGKDTNETVKMMKEMRLLEKVQDVIDKTVKKLDSIERNLPADLDMAAINASLPKAYRLTDEHLKAVMGPTEAERWYAEAIKEKERLVKRYGISHRENLTKFAKDGTPVRSKSEVIIANALIDRGVPYIYEMPLKISGELFRPDFCFYSPKKKKMIIWEHIGRLGDAKYMKSFAYKTEKYTLNGYTPCIDVIFTFDIGEGDIDSRTVEKILDELL